MAKGIPLMGRDPDGKAKMINVDENGNVKVQLSGTKASIWITAADQVVPAGGTVDVQEFDGTEPYSTFRVAFADDYTDDIEVLYSATRTMGNYGFNQRLFAHHVLPIESFDPPNLAFGFGYKTTNDIPIFGNAWRISLRNTSDSEKRVKVIEIRRLP